MYPEPKVDLSVDFCGVKFEHPFILAAAPPTDELDMVRDAFKAGWSAAILKTTSVEGAAVDLVYPLISGIDSGPERATALGNIDLISIYHIDEVEKRIRALKEEFPSKRVIASISGMDRDSWQAVARRSREAGADMIECSFSCPQGSMGLAPGAMLGQDPSASAEVTRWIKEASGDRPVIIKLTPQVSDIASIARSVKDAGADAVCVGNTLPALMGVNLDSLTPVPDIGNRSTYSGLSGTAVKPVSLRCVAEVSRGTGLPIAASGGAISWHDALEFMLLGANVVEFCTAVMHYGADIIEELVEGVSFHLERKGISALREIIGESLKHMDQLDHLSRGKWRPEIDMDLCIRCGRCMISCRDGGHRAIALDAERAPKVDDLKCTGCGLCSAICPVWCIEMQQRQPSADSQQHST